MHAIFVNNERERSQKGLQKDAASFMRRRKSVSELHSALVVKSNESKRFYSKVNKICNTQRQSLGQNNVK